MRLIAFCGPKGCGKDTAAKRLLVRGGNYQHINFADPVKRTCGELFGFGKVEMNNPDKKEVALKRWPYLVPRKSMQDVANWVRDQYGQDFWALRWFGAVGEAIKNSPAPDRLVVVCTDLRFPLEELDVIRNFGGTVAYVYNPKVEQARHEGIELGDPLWCNISESHAEVLNKKADLLIQNNKGIDDLYTEVDKYFPATEW